MNGKTPHFILPDTLKQQIIKTDSLQLKSDSLNKDDDDDEMMEAPVFYQAEDSLILELKNEKLYLFNEADVKYTEIALKAGFISLEFGKKLVFAGPIPDTAGVDSQHPIFKDGEQEFKATKINYNFETKKGLIKDVITNEGESFVHGEFVKKENDSMLYIRNGKYTTCNNPNPHFHIHASKLKIIKDDKIIMGPAYFAVEGIPTPAVLPFGFFPNKKGRSNGILMPQPGESPELGFFLQNGGYYAGIGDYMDIALTGDIYSRGSYRIGAASNYKARYKFSGITSFSYSKFLRGLKDYNQTEDTDFFLRWNHRQDAKASPGFTFSADVNFGSRNFNRLNSFNTTDFVNNQFQSNISMSKTLNNLPLTLTMNARHSQNTQNKTVNLTLPQTSIIMNRIFPFKRKVQVGDIKWYEKIGITYTGDFRNELSVADSMLFKPRVLRNARYGAQHFIPLTTSMNVLKYFTFSPSFNYRERWYFKTINKSYDQETNSTKTDTLNNFRRLGEWDMSANLSTKIYGMYMFKSGKINAIRHVITPNIGFTYRPDFSTLQRVNAGVNQSEIAYNPYELGIFGVPGTGEVGSINFNLINNLEMKVKNNNDTASQPFKKIKLFENFDFGGSYNFLADSFQLSNIRVSARTILFNNVSLVGNASFDPYSYDPSTRVRRSIFQVDKNGNLANLMSADLAVSFSLRSKNQLNQSEIKKQTELVTQAEIDMVRNNPDYYVDFNVPYNLSVNYSIRLNRTVNQNREENNVFNEQITQNITFFGDVNVTKYWKVGFNSGFDFRTLKMTNTTLNIYRDLHCWEMRIDIIPFGFNRSYTFTMNVKSSILQDLRLTRRRGWYDFRGTR